MEDSVFIKTEGAFAKFCFWLQISNFWQKQKQKIQVYSGFRTPQICLSSSLCLIMDRRVGELGGLGYSQSNIFADHNIFLATTGVNAILKYFLDPTLLQPLCSLASVNIYCFC